MRFFSKRGKRIISLVASNRIGQAWCPALAALLALSAAVRGQAPVPPEAPKLEIEGKVEDRAPIRTKQQSEDEYNAYCQALIAAHTTPIEALASSARRDLTYAHLFEEPHKYRGEVIHVQGRLKRVRRFDPPSFVKTYDIANLYEGWIFDPEIHGANPMCLVFTELPPGIQVKEDMDQLVAFDGYFFKRYRYRAADVWRDAPMLIGRSPRLIDAPAAVYEGTRLFTQSLVTSFCLLLVVTGALVALLTVWYRRGDRRVRSVLTQINPPTFVEPQGVGESHLDGRNNGL